MEQVVGVRFKKAGKIYYFAPNNLHLQINDGVIVETSRGMEYGYIVTIPVEERISEDNGPLKPVIRKATIKDTAQLERNRERENSAFAVCIEKIEKFKVPMKLLRTEYTFDRSKIVFFLQRKAALIFVNW